MSATLHQNASVGMRNKFLLIYATVIFRVIFGSIWLMHTSDWIFPLPKSLLWNTHCEIYCIMASDSSRRIQLQIFILSISPALSAYVSHSLLILPCLWLTWHPEHSKMQSLLYPLLPSNWTLNWCPLLVLLISAYSLKSAQMILLCFILLKAAHLCLARLQRWCC